MVHGPDFGKHRSKQCIYLSKMTHLCVCREQKFESKGVAALKRLRTTLLDDYEGAICVNNNNIYIITIPIGLTNRNNCLLKNFYFLLGSRCRASQERVRLRSSTFARPDLRDQGRSCRRRLLTGWKLNSMKILTLTYYSGPFI
jgi:hypothetical protein